MKIEVYFDDEDKDSSYGNTNSVEESIDVLMGQENLEISIEGCHFDGIECDYSVRIVDYESYKEVA